MINIRFAIRTVPPSCNSHDYVQSSIYGVCCDSDFSGLAPFQSAPISEFFFLPLTILGLVDSFSSVKTDSQAFCFGASRVSAEPVKARICYWSDLTVHQLGNDY